MSKGLKTPKQILGLGIYSLVTGFAATVLPYTLSKTSGWTFSKVFWPVCGFMGLLTGVVALIDGLAKLKKQKTATPGSGTEDISAMTSKDSPQGDYPNSSQTYETGPKEQPMTSSHVWIMVLGPLGIIGGGLVFAYVVHLLLEK